MNISFKEIFKTPKLYKDFLYDFPKVETFYSGDYKKGKTYSDIFCQLDKKTFPRDEIVSLLTRQNKNFGCSEKTLENIQLLEKAGSYCVFTGQQVGIFGGPLYTFYKAISAIKLAKSFSQKFGKNLIPLFWLASDDHDFDEVKSVGLLDKENNFVQLDYLPREDVSGKSMAKISLDENIEKLLSQLKDCFFQTEFEDDVFKKLKDLYHPGGKITQAFASWLSFLLGKYGLVVIDPSDAEFKRLALPVFLKEIENPKKTNQLLQKTNLKLKSLGYHLQVHKTEDLANFFIDEGKRVRVKIADEKFTLEGTDKRLSGDELKKIIQEDPSRISPNVILKTVVQSYVFPTAIYVGGPGEISYYAQTKEIFEFFDVGMPVIYPRASLTLVEPKIEKILEKYSLPFTQLFDDVESLINFVMRKNLPHSLEKNLKEANERIQEELDSLEKVIRFDPTLERTLKTTQNKIGFELKSLEKKIFQSHKKQNQIISDQIHKAKSHLFRDRKLQEREISILPFLVRYGFEIIDYLYDKIDINVKDHQILVMLEAEKKKV
jgi:bacillithiol synthase